jgi:hypothetical protein
MKNNITGRTARLSLLLLLAFLLPAGYLVAQQVQEFTGRVADQSGAVVPKATVVAHNLDTGLDTPTTTTSTGDFTIPYLIPGRYSVSVRSAGFETAVRTGLVLQVDQASTVNFTLKIGIATETITVNADSLLDAAKADNGTDVENTRITELPLNGRDPGMLAILAPGTLYENGNNAHQGPFDDTQRYMSVNGGGTGGIGLMMDGVPNATSPINNGGSAVINYVPPVDSVQEFKIVTNPYDAQYGLMAGAVEDVTLKTGGDKIHGDVYEFARRTWLDANTWQNDWFQKTASPGTNLVPFETAQMKWDQYGAEVDGPLELPFHHHGQAKTFFTVQYESFKEVVPNTVTDSVPSPQWLTGDFSNDTYWNGTGYSPVTIYDPLSIQLNAGGQYIRQPFGPTDPVDPGPANVIPMSRINPVALAIMKLYPAPNTTPPAGTNPFTNNYITQAPETNRYRNVLAKFDRNFSDKDRASLSYGYWERVLIQSNNGFPGPLNNGYVPLGERSNTVTLRETHTFTPQLLFDFRVNVGLRYDFVFDGPEYNATSLLGWSPALVASLGPIGAAQFPSLSFGQGFTGGGTNSNGQDVKGSLNLFPTVTWVKKQHTIHAGIDVRFWQTDNNIPGGGENFYTDQTWTQSQCGSCSGNQIVQNSGNSIASFLLGVPSSGGDNISVKTFWTAHYIAPFVQDDWKVSKKLTLNLGVRWDLLPAEIERHNRGNYAFDTVDANPIQVPIAGFGQIKGGLTFLGVNGAPRSTYALTKDNFQPRIGFAYAYNDKTVLRGGFGESVRAPANSPDSAGFSSSTSYQANNPNYPGSVMPNLANPINNPFSFVVQPNGASLGLETQLGQGPYFLNPKYRTPHFWNYSLGFERQLTAHDMINVSYVGTRLYDGDSSDDFDRESASAIESRNCNPDFGGEWENCNNYNVANPFLGISAFQGTSYYNSAQINGLNLTRPYPQFGDITEYQLNQGRSWFNSLQVVGDHRMSKGFVLHAAWTYSRLMDAGGYQDTTFRVPFRQLDPNDHSHIVSVSGVYTLPIGRGRAVGTHMNRVLDTAIGGWEVGSLFTLQSGAPWSLPFKYMLHSPYVHPHIQKDSGFIRMFAPCIEVWNDGTNPQTGQPVYTLTQLQNDNPAGCPNGPDMENVGSWMPQPDNVSQGVRLLRSSDLDVNLSKNFAIVEGFHLQLRLEAFNAPNHPEWAESPDGSGGDAQFGEIQRGPSGQSNVPREIQLSAKIVW